MNWWELYHEAMTALPWATPAAIGKLTLPQLICLTNAKPPGSAATCKTFAEYQAALDRQAAADAAWGA